MANNSIQTTDLTEKEEFFADYFRSLRLRQRLQNPQPEDILIWPRKKGYWHRYRQFMKGRNRDMETISQYVAGRSTNAKTGHNLGKSAAMATTVKTEHDGAGPSSSLLDILPGNEELTKALTNIFGREALWLMINIIGPILVTISPYLVLIFIIIIIISSAARYLG